MKPIEYYKDREQTYLKHFFLERYLEKVAYHIGFTNPEFVYVDCFAGPWRNKDEDLGDTSIRIALDRLNSVREGLTTNRKYPIIRAIFVEESPKAFATLQQVLRDHSGGIETTALPGTFEENISRIIELVGVRFAFFFIDPTGWTGFSMDSIQPILQRGKGEVMVNLMFDFVNRFLSVRNAGNEASLDRLFGTANWRAILNRPDREAALVELYVEQVRATGAFPYATFTRVLKPLHDRAYFHLVYATRSAKGVEEFRNVEKRVVQEQEVVRERAQRENREIRSRQNEFGFELDVPSRGLRDERAQQLRKAEIRIQTLIGEGPIRYERLLPQVLELPLVWKSDLNEILLRERRRDGHTGSLLIEGLGLRERTPKEGCVIRKAKP